MKTRSSKTEKKSKRKDVQSVLVVTDKPGVQLWSGMLFRLGLSTPFSETAFTLRTAASLSAVVAAVRAVVGKETTISAHKITQSLLTIGDRDTSGLLDSAERFGRIDDRGHLRFEP